MKDSLGNLLSSGLSGGVAPSLPPSLSPATLGTIHSVITDSITQGVRWATFTAAIFVSFGALSSLMIPSPRLPLKQEVKVATIVPSRASRITKIALIGQFVLIETLLFALSSEYSANAYMQDWFSANAWLLGYLLGGYIAPVLGIVLGATTLLAGSILKNKPEPKKAVAEITPLATAA
jgi:hypothetical protein